jgi:hypothetical protein
MKHTALHLILVGLNLAGAFNSAWRHNVAGMCIFAVGVLVTAEIGAWTRGIVGAADEIRRRMRSVSDLTARGLRDEARKDTLQ